MSAAILEAVLGNLAVATALAALAFAVGRWANRPAIAQPPDPAPTTMKS